MDIGLQEQFNLPLVQDLISENEKLRETAQLTEGTKLPDSKIDKIKVPFIWKNRLLMQEGEFNGVNYSKADIVAAMADAADKGLMYDHLDTSGQGALAWVGTIRNPHWDITEQGEGMHGDLVVVDKQCAQKLAAGAKWGVSPTIDYHKNEEDGKVVGTDLLWKSFSFVTNPAVRDTMLNSKKEGDTMSEETNAGKNKFPYKYPKDQQKFAKKKKKEEEEKKGEEKMSEINVTEDVKALLEAKDAEISELRAFRDEIENNKKTELVSELAYNEFLIGRLEANELEDREKSLSAKSLEMLSELSDVIGSHAELQSFRQFVKDFLKKNPGKTVKDAAAAWNKQKDKGTGKMAELQDPSETAELESMSLTSDVNCDPERRKAELSERHSKGDAQCYEFIRKGFGGVV